MALDRVKLQELLETITPKVYFQPPENVKLVYPCIIYSRDALNTRFADNIPYRHKKRYQVTVIDRDPDSPLPDVVANLLSCTFDRFYTADNLNHDVYTLYY